jgi:D-tyrosyl-tRNA(Tyr) deacylase
MKGVLQRVRRAEVRVDGASVGSIEPLADKVSGLRIFEDTQGKMNLALSDAAGSVLAVSQFTLLADTKRGRRPSFTGAMEPASAEKLFDVFCAALRARGLRVETGRFGASMQVELVNDGPVTILLDTR